MRAAENVQQGAEEDPPDSPRPHEVEDLGPDVVTGEVVESVRVTVLVDDVDVDAVPSPPPQEPGKPVSPVCGPGEEMQGEWGGPGRLRRTLSLGGGGGGGVAPGI